MQESNNTSPMNKEILERVREFTISHAKIEITS